MTGSTRNDKSGPDNPAFNQSEAANTPPLDGLRSRERRTLRVMTGIYCRDTHGSHAGLCPECEGLLVYAGTRLARCRYGAEKPACKQCPAHCYAPAQRDEIRRVMRYAGPRMLLREPVLAILHFLHKWLPHGVRLR